MLTRAAVFALPSAVLIGAGFVLVAGSTAARAPVPTAATSSAASLAEQPMVRAAGLPLTFEPNVGQAGDGVLFVGRAPGAAVLVGADHAVLATTARGGGQSVIAMRLEGADVGSPRAVDPLPGRANYLRGADPEAWIRDVPTYARVAVTDVYPGVDLQFRGGDGRLEYDFLVAPGADPSPIAMRFGGADEVTLDADGDLVLATATGEIRIHAPFTYQETPAGGREVVESAFELRQDGSVAFALGAHDRGRTLVIDPVITYGSYLGTADDDAANTVAVDGKGNVYVGGNTVSLDLSTRSSAFQSNKGDASTALTDGFVMQLDPTLRAAVFTTYLGGSADDDVTDIAIGAANEIYVAGNTDSTDFPLQSARDGSRGPGEVAFLTRLEADGTELVFSTFANAGLCAGLAASGDGPFLLLAEGGGALVEAYNTTGSSLRWSRTVGADEEATPHDIAWDASAGAVCVVGGTTSSGFPTTSGAFDRSFSGGEEGFVFALDEDDGSLDWSSFLGAGGADACLGVTVSPPGNVIVAGRTASTDLAVTNASQTTNAGGVDAMVAVFASDGDTVSFLTYLGGMGDDAALSAVAQPGRDDGDLFVVGTTSSTDFPTASAAQGSNKGGVDGFVTHFTHTGSRVSSSYLGGGGDEAGLDVTLGPGGRLAIVGTTDSSDLTTTTPSLARDALGGTDGFLSGVTAATTTLSVTTFSLPAFTSSLLYSQQLGGFGGTEPYAWSVADGAIPAGTTLSEDGLLEGTLTTPGVYTFRVKVTDADGYFAVRDYTVVINDVTSVATPFLSDWTVDEEIDIDLFPGGGTSPYTWSVVDGELPGGIEFATDGSYRGTFTSTDPATFTVQVVDALGVAGTRELTQNINPQPRIVDDVFPDCTTGRPYVGTLGVADGTGPYQWEIIAGSPPVNLPDDFLTMGKPTGFAKAPGTYQFTVELRDAVGGSATRDYSVTINDVPTIPTTSLSAATFNRPYTSGASVVGGTAPFQWFFTSNRPVSGVLLDSATGELEGQPLIAGTFPVELQVFDACGASATAQFELIVAPIFDLARKKNRDDLVYVPGDQATRRFALELLKDTVLDVKITRVGKGTVPVEIGLIGNDLQEIALDNVTAGKKKVQLKKFIAPETGRYFLEIRATEPPDGTLRVDVSVKARTTYTGNGPVGGIGQPNIEVVVPAQPGATLTINAARGKKSRVVARIRSVFTDAGTQLATQGTLKEGRTGTKLKFKTQSGLLGGTIRAIFGAQAGSEGDLKWKIKFKNPKLYEFSLPELPTGFVVDPE